MRTGLVLSALLASTPFVLAVDAAKVDEAVKRGVAFLNGFHGAGANPGQHGNGSIALSGMALLAAGVKDTDPTVTGIANHLRPQVFTDSKTYNVALMLLFFDKLGKPADEGLIQLLGVKLLSGQNGVGGWGYETWSAGPLDGGQWVAAFRNWKPDGRMHPEVANLYRATRLANRAAGAGGIGIDDNSNTQFALIAMWVAGKHGVPIRESAALIDLRFLRTQDPQSGGWGYNGSMGATPSMTCAGLLGLAVGFGSRQTDTQLETDKPPPSKKDDDDDPFNKPPSPGGDKKGEEEKPVGDPLQNRRKAIIDRGLLQLGAILKGTPAPTSGVTNTSHGGPSDLYFYWSVERVGVAYGIDRIGGVDWYEWGAPSLLQSQSPNGSWGGSYGEEVGTSFAILFLTRANFAVDLSAKLKNKFGSELRGGHSIMKAIPFAEQKTPERKAGEPPPKISGIREVSLADKLSDALVASIDRDFADKLKEYQGAKGEQYTVAIAFALNQLEKDNKKKARAALVNRLVRMSPESLRKYMTVNSPELRRATCLACASKDDKTHIPDLVSRINDPDDDVAQAARAGLRSLAGEDYGPTPGAGEEEKQAALSKWRFWISSRGK